jgi:hypothetical protein
MEESAHARLMVPDILTPRAPKSRARPGGARTVDGGSYVGLRTVWGPLRLEAGSAGPRSCRFPPFGRPAPAPSAEMVIGSTGREAQAKTLRLRMYFLCSECAHLIDLAEDNRPQRDIESMDLIRHAAEEHAAWLEILGISESA